MLRKCIKKYVNFSILVKKMKYLIHTIRICHFNNATKIQDNQYNTWNKICKIYTIYLMTQSSELLTAIQILNFLVKKKYFLPFKICAKYFQNFRN